MSLVDPCHRDMTIIRARNGWVVRVGFESQQCRGTEIPMAVAETPEALAELVKTWACAQALEADKSRNRDNQRLRGE